MPFIFRAFVALYIATFATVTAAQLPDTQILALSPSILQPPTSVPYSVAVDGDLTVIGVPNDDTGAKDSGIVRIYNTNTGALLHTLQNPSPAESSRFGFSVAISAAMSRSAAPTTTPASSMRALSTSTISAFPRPCLLTRSTIPPR